MAETIRGAIKKRPCVLIADDEPLIVVALRGFLKDQPWDVVTADNGREALKLLLARRPDVAVLDLRMPGLTGLEVLERATRRKTSTDIVILTAYATISGAVEALRAGAKDFIIKPVQKAQFLGRMRSLMGERPNSAHVLANRLAAYVRDNCSNPALTQADLLEQFHISKSYVCRLFRELGTTFTNMLARVRIEKAKHLIHTTDKPLYAIAEACGFRNARRLSEVFHRLEGCSPSRYRQLGRPGRTK